MSTTSISFALIALLSIIISCNKAHSFTLLPLRGQPSHSIIDTKHGKSYCSSKLSSLLLPSTEEEEGESSKRSNSELMRDYMIRSHESKLRALKDLSDKKDKEIRELKSRLNDDEGASSSSSSVDELQNQINHYQKFISNYIIKAQEDKIRAIKEIENKSNEKLVLLLGSAASAPSSDSTSSYARVDALPAAGKSLSESFKIYQDRSTKIADAVAVNGKSPRWGDAEVEKAQSIADREILSSPATASYTVGGRNNNNNVNAINSDVENVLDRVSPPP